MESNKYPYIWIVLSNQEFSQSIVNTISSINPNVSTKIFTSYVDAFKVIQVLERKKLPRIVYLGCSFPNEGTAIDFITLLNDHYLEPRFEVHIIAKTYNINNLDNLLENKLVKGWYPGLPTRESLTEAITNL
jgi:hypothetical protein